jgi:hypothetical protein
VRWLLLLLTGCDAVFGLHDVQVRPTDATHDTLRDADTAYVMTVLGDKPVAYLPLDELVGPTAHDLIPSGPEGMIVDEVMLGQDRPFPAALHSMTFNGVDGAVDLGDNFPFLGTAPYSIECWFSADSTASVPFYEIISKWHENGLDSEPASGWNLFYTSASDVDTTREAGADVPDIIGMHFQSGWHHVVATYDGATLSIYVDGTPGPAKGAANSLKTISEHLMIGAGNGDPRGVPMYGSIAQVAIYDYPLTALRVAAHYTASTQ